MNIGSPPRAWGQRRSYAHRKRLSRFTPTGVGTTYSFQRYQQPDKVHPHGRGDNPESPTRLARPAGSPPRAWGQLLALVGADADTRFTPTGVGTTRRRLTRISSAKVHPHGRGDNSNAPNGCAETYGSPPRAWGQHVPPRPADGPRRFTPTGVGTTN